MNNQNDQQQDKREYAKGIRIICVYLEEFVKFKDQCLNFCSDYEVARGESEDGKLTFNVKYKRVLPNDFFSVLKNGTHCVSSVSALVGGNSAGKTSFARLFYDLVCGNEMKTQALRSAIVFEQKGRIKVLTTMQEDMRFNLISETVSAAVHELWEKVEVCRIDKYSFEYPFKFFYYSPHYTTELVLQNNGETFLDISTSGLLMHPSGNFELLLRNGVQQASIYDAAEKLRLLEFAAEYEKAAQSARREELRDFKIPLPQQVLVAPFDEEIRVAVNRLFEKVKKGQDEVHGLQKTMYSTMRASNDELRDPVSAFLRELVEPLRECALKGGFFQRAFYGFAACYLSECGLLQTPSLISDYERNLKDFLIANCETEGERLMSAVVRFLEDNIPSYAVNDPRSKLRASCNPALELFKTLKEMCGKREVMALQLKLSNSKEMERAFGLVRNHALVRVFSPFLRFSIAPRMSSGEASFLSLFSRMYSFVRDKTKVGDDVVIFMDEAETTLHLDWQRRIVSWMIRFFEVFIPDRHYQLIFASHSPILLSDIPAGNVCFLKEYEDKETIVVGSLAGERRNTFGANVYDLFKDGFFLTDGSVGEFAAEKIKSVLQHLSESPGIMRTSEGMNVRQIASLVGDRVLYGYFNGLRKCGLI